MASGADPLRRTGALMGKVKRWLAEGVQLPKGHKVGKKKGKKKSERKEEVTPPDYSTSLLSPVTPKVREIVCPACGSKIEMR